jgi:hypothetical protein
MNSPPLANATQLARSRDSCRAFAFALGLAILASASTWFYMDSILRAEQITAAASQSHPRGNLSDLYPRWLGARELLRQGRNPYSEQVTREIQTGYYGRPLDPARPEDPKDQQGFTYPVYVVFLLAPTVSLPFPQVQAGFRWFLMFLAPASVFLWLRFLRWKLSFGWITVLCVLILGWLPMVQGIKLQQLTLLVAGLLAGSIACLAAGWLSLAGGLLALATIKPQLAWPLVLWLLAWAVSDWRQRKRFVLAFTIATLLLIGGAELILPGWLRMFVSAIGRYHQYTHNQSVLLLLFGPIAGRTFEIVCLLACGALIWPSRPAAAASETFGQVIALVLALTVVIVPMMAPYNQVLLVPAILVLARTATSQTPLLPSYRLAGGIALALLVWPWVATLALAAAYFWITPSLRHHLWLAPFYSNVMLPIFIFALAALDRWRNAPSGLREAFAAE